MLSGSEKPSEQAQVLDQATELEVGSSIKGSRNTSSARRTQREQTTRRSIGPVRFLQELSVLL